MSFTHRPHSIDDPCVTCKKSEIEEKLDAELVYLEKKKSTVMSQADIDPFNITTQIIVKERERILGIINAKLLKIKNTDHRDIGDCGVFHLSGMSTVLQDLLNEI